MRLCTGIFKLVIWWIWWLDTLKNSPNFSETQRVTSIDPPEVTYRKSILWKMVSHVKFWLLGEKIKITGHKTGLSACCRVPLCALISESDSWGSADVQTLLTCPDQTRETRVSTFDGWSRDETPEMIQKSWWKNRNKNKSSPNFLKLTGWPPWTPQRSHTKNQPSTSHLMVGPW